jgi:hypothetical protein
MLLLSGTPSRDAPGAVALTPILESLPVMLLTRGPRPRALGIAALVAALLVSGVTVSAPRATAGTAAARVTATAPRAQVSDGAVQLGYALSASRRTTLTSVKVRVRPVDGSTADRVRTSARNLRIDGRRSFVHRVPVTPGQWRTWVTWTQDGRHWSSGPATTFSVPRVPSAATVQPVSQPTAQPTAEPSVMTAAKSVATSPTTGTSRLFGTLQSSTAHLTTNRTAGLTAATFDVYWDRFEPVEGRVNTTYANELKADLATYRAAGVQLVLSTGVQYPPSWLLSYPESRFVNQYGDRYAPTDSGKGVADMVFNQRMRDKQEAYLKLLFATLGTQFYGVRLGGGWYGELNYPDATYNGHANSYWAFGAIAAGRASGLPSGIPVNPVPGWVPGTPTADHTAASQFATWYLEALRNYHDWQIRAVRRLYAGRLLMMYPSWGLRSGQLDAAVGADLAGSTSAERNGEVQRGFDFARFVGGITDANVVVYTTWLDADASGDAGTDSRYWSPVKWLAGLARNRRTPLAVMGENTGFATKAQLDLTVSQARANGLAAVMWAFEPQLYGGSYATIDDLAAAISLDRTG